VPKVKLAGLSVVKASPSQTQIHSSKGAVKPRNAASKYYNKETQLKVMLDFKLDYWHMRRRVQPAGIG
jgi:hypothetical protein